MNIEKMSIKFANEIYGGNMVEDKWLKARYFYAKGANAVLEEIEKALKQAKLYSDLSCKSRLYDDLVNLVEQLKK